MPSSLSCFLKVPVSVLCRDGRGKKSEVYISRSIMSKPCGCLTLPGDPDTLRKVGPVPPGAMLLLAKEDRESASLRASKETPTQRSAPIFDGIPLLSHRISGLIPPPIHRPDDWSNCAAPTCVTCRSEGVKYSAMVSRSALPSGKGKVC